MRCESRRLSALVPGGRGPGLGREAGRRAAPIRLLRPDLPTSGARRPAGPAGADASTLVAEGALEAVRDPQTRDRGLGGGLASHPAAGGPAVPPGLADRGAAEPAADPA